MDTLDAQRESAEAFIVSQRQEGWIALPQKYDNGGFTGADMERPALKRLLDDVRSGLVTGVVVYKVDRLTRSLLDFSRIVEVFDKHGANFVSVTQQFNTTASLGRLTLNILLSFAQFEREMIAERTRDKMSAARRKGKWVGGGLPERERRGGSEKGPPVMRHRDTSIPAVPDTRPGPGPHPCARRRSRDARAPRFRQSRAAR